VLEEQNQRQSVEKLLDPPLTPPSTLVRGISSFATKLSESDVKRFFLSHTRPSQNEHLQNGLKSYFSALPK
jgi:hypothetical protein